MEGKSIFAKRLREARETIGISQKQLGIQAGIDRFVASARINQYERGKHIPDLSTAQRMAAELHVPVSYLFEPDEGLAALLLIVGRMPAGEVQALIQQLSESSTQGS